MNHNLGAMLNALSAERTLGRLARFPLELVPPTTVVPILMGRLRGKKWIAGSAIHRCWLGLYEYEKQQRVSREVRPNTVFYDVGAHVGFYSLLASALVGSGKVFAFEPVPRNLAYLREHLALNHVTNVEVLPVAVSDKTGMAPFHMEQTGFMGCLSSEGSIMVPTATLDSLVQDGRIPPPDYIKMDVEGVEFLALLGAKECLQTYKPILFLATHGHDVEVECRQQLESLGYELSNIGESSDPDHTELFAKFHS